MQVFATGFNHKTAPVEIREKFSWTGSRGESIQKAMGRLSGVHEVAVLATCNRLEVYAVLDPYHEGRDSLLEFMSYHGGMELSALRPCLYTFNGHEAARHLFRVACGLDAMVVGESQILGQVRAAYRSAGRLETVGKMLHELFQQALRAGKRAHTETMIGRHAASVSYAAIELAREVFDDLLGRVVLVIGAGETAELALESLHGRGVGKVVVANRTSERARALAGKYGGWAVSLEDIPAYLATADIVISSTSAPGWVLTTDMLCHSMQARRAGSRLLVIDLAVPRDVEPAAGNVEGVHLHDIDDISQVVAANLTERERELPRVEAIVRQEVIEFEKWLNSLDVVPVIRSLRGKAHRIRSDALERIFNKLGHLDARQRQVIEAATAVMINKILNDPTVRLREHAGRNQAEAYVSAVNELFNLFDEGNPAEQIGEEPLYRSLNRPPGHIERLLKVSDKP